MIVFDLDGTLIDCRARQVALARHVAGAGLDEDRFWAAKRGGATTARALADQGFERAEALAAEWVRLVERDEWLALDALLPGAREALRRTAHAMVLTARSDGDALARQVRRLAIADFAHVVIVDPAVAADHKSEVLREVHAAAFIGDTESDARAAESAGVPFLAVDTGQRDAAFLSARGWPPVPGGVLAAVQALATT